VSSEALALSVQPTTMGFPMRSRTLGLLTIATCLLPRPSAAEDVARASVNVNVQVAARTSLKVSRELLQFDVAEPGHPSTAAIEFSAGARTPSDALVLLTVEPFGAIDGPDGAACADAVLDVAADGDGIHAAPIAGASSTVIGRWHGSGLRQGRLVFTLHARATGSYTVPIRLVLSTP
jgi:hypothetical protein